jgi:hypothetical protein
MCAWTNGLGNTIKLRLVIGEPILLRMTQMSLDSEAIKIAKNLRCPHQCAHPNILKHGQLEGSVAKDV